MTIDEAMKIVSGVAGIDLKKMSFEDQLKFATAYLQFAKAMKPFYDKYVRQYDSGDIDALIDAYLKEQGEK